MHGRHVHLRRHGVVAHSACVPWTSWALLLGMLLRLVGKVATLLLLLLLLLEVHGLLIVEARWCALRRALLCHPWLLLSRAIAVPTSKQLIINEPRWRRSTARLRRVRFLRHVGRLIEPERKAVLPCLLSLLCLLRCRVRALLLQQVEEKLTILVLSLRLLSTLCREQVLNVDVWGSWPA